jgi:TP901 family phage tail tape measure protein
VGASGQFQINAIFRAIDKFSAPVAQMHSKVTALSSYGEKGFKGLTKAADAYVGVIHGAARAIGAFGLAAGAGLAYAAKAGIDFDQQMADVAAVSLMSRNQIGDLEAAARRLGRTTKFTATEVGSAMELMGKAGFTNVQILQSIDGVLAAAAAEGEGLAETTGHVSNVLKGMGLEADQTGRVADVLALAAARTNSSISSLGESMSNVSSTARQFNIPLEQVVGSVALLQDVGLDASVAGSALNTMLTQLAAPSDKAKEAMRALGVKFKDAEGNMLPLKDVFAQMQKAMDGSKGNMSQVAFFAELVGLRGQKAAQNLADLFKSGKVNTLFEELEKAEGVAHDMADLRMDTFQGDMTKLGAAVNGLQIDLFDLNKGGLRDVVQAMTDWVNVNHDVIVSGAREYLEKIAKNLPEIIDTGLKIGKVAAAFYAWSVAIKGVKLAVDTYTVSAKLVGAVGATIRWAAVQAGLFNTNVHLAGEGLSAWRARLNAGATSQAINGINDKLGRLGMLGLALGVGFAIGGWINELTGADKALANLMARIAGLEGRNQHNKLDDRNQVLRDGVVVNGITGELVSLGLGIGDGPGEAAKRKKIFEEWHEKRRFRREVGDKPFATNTSQAPQGTTAVPGAGSFAELSKAPIQIVSPQEQVLRSVEETKNTTQVEIAVKAESGTTAKLKKKPKGPIKMSMPSTGTP